MKTRRVHEKSAREPVRTVKRSEVSSDKALRELALRELALSTISTAELVREILRRGGARLYGNATGKADFWVRISYGTFTVKTKPAHRIPDPSNWSEGVGIAE